MGNHFTDARGVWLRSSHTLLCATHFTGGNHFHGTGNFTRTLDTSNFSSYFFGACHSFIPLIDYHVWVALKSSRAALMLSSISLSKSPFSLMRSTTALCSLLSLSNRAASKRA